MNIDFIKFGLICKQIRTGLNLTRAQVHESTGIAAETIRRLENGLESKISTIELLTTFYKFDLLDAVIACRYDHHLFSSAVIHKVIDSMRSMDYTLLQETLDILISDLKVQLKSNSHAHYVLAFIQSLSQIKMNYTRNLDTCISNTEQMIMSLSHSSSIVITDKFISDFEMYLALFLATQYRRAEMVNQSIDLLNKLQERLLKYPLLTYTQRNFMVTISLNLCYAYHYFDDHEKVIQIVNHAITNPDFMFSSTTYNDFLLRKAVALFSLNKSDHKILFASIIMNETKERAKQITETASKMYNIDLTKIV